MHRSHKYLAYFFFRFSLGLIFLFYGIGKHMMGPEAFASKLVTQFADTPLPAHIVKGFGLGLPFAEIGLGGLLILGLFTRLTLSLTAMLMMGLTFGTILLQQPPTVMQNLFYSFTVFVLLFYLEYNAISIDGIRRPRDQFREEDIPRDVREREAILKGANREW